jgi:short-subunit dehydrogenase
MYYYCVLTVENRVVLVTGASDGIGAACAQVLRARGARLALTGRSSEKLARVSRPEDVVVSADLTAPGGTHRVVNETLARFGRIDVLINNAGSGIYWPAAESPPAETRAMFDLNLFAPLALAQAVIPHMRAQGSGSIVNVGSIAGCVALPWLPLYSASKFALGALTGSLRMELAGAGIHVMLVCPGYVKTDFQAHAIGPAPPKVAEGKRFAITPVECAEAIVRGMERRARIVMAPRVGWFLVALHNLAPRAVEAHLMHLQHSADPA